MVLISVANESWFSAPTSFKGRRSKGSTNKFLAQVGNGKTILACPKRRTFISQGDAADAVFYIQTEKVKLTVISSQGKEEIIAMLEPGAISSSMISASYCY